MPIEWGSKYALGVVEIDTQHQKLFSLINEIEKSARSGTSREVVGNVIESLLEYTSIHFTGEERIMAEAGYPQLEEHRKEHENLLSQVRDFKRKYDTSKGVMSMELMGFLVNWLSNHIDRSDRAYVPYLKGD